jgi:hypothetical protein
MDLYLDKLPELEADFRKEAGFAARVGEQPENWPQELTSELLKQLPYLSDYNMNVNLDRVDPGRGFAFGYADVSNKTERPEVEHGEAGLPHVRVPLVVMERGVKPFSTYMDGERVLPLTEDRIRETLFNPATFDISATPPRDPSLIEATMPPTRSGMGMGGEYKQASADISLLKLIAPTIREKDAEAFVEKVANDSSLQAGFKRSGMVQDLIEVFDKTKRASAEERLSYLAGAVEPTTITLHKLPGGDFLVKSANVNALNPQDMQGQVVPGQEAAQAIGPENAAAMQPGQTTTLTSQPIDLDEPYESKAKPCEEFGQYKVMDTMGNQLVGWVFPETLAWDGQFSRQPLAVFSNGSAFAMQDSVAGVLIGKSADLPSEAQPVGEGVFYVTQGGNAICTQPITVQSTMAGPDGNPKIIAHDAMGQQLQISFVDGLSSPMRVSDIEYAFPKAWKFMRLNNQTQLQGGGMDTAMGGEPAPEQGGMSDAPPNPAGAPGSADPAGGGAGGGAPKAAKPAGKKPEKKDEKKPAKKDAPTVEVNVGEKAKKEKTSAVLWYNGGFHIQGGCGLNKLAADYRFDMSPVDAEFMLGLLGVDGVTAKQKVAEARRQGSVKLAGLKTIRLLSERYADAEKTASALASIIPDLRRDLIKEAAVMEDKNTVDNLLALNFINPENLSTFVGYVPELEATSERLAEMLLFSQLGMNQLPESAVERSMKTMEEVVTGLKAVASAES